MAIIRYLYTASLTAIPSTGITSYCSRSSWFFWL